VERASHHTGTSIVSLTVLPDGSVDDVHLIGSSYPGMNEITQQIVKEWKFKPAMCGSEPVATDIEVDVNFRLR
jgi:TonB family protein